MAEIDRVVQTFDNGMKKVESAIERVHQRIDTIDIREQKLEVAFTAHTNKENIHHETPCAFIEEFHRRTGILIKILGLIFTLGLLYCAYTQISDPYCMENHDSRKLKSADNN